MYITTPIKTEKEKRIIHVEFNSCKVPDLELMRARQNCKAQVFKDKRKSKPKYKENYLEY